MIFERRRTLLELTRIIHIWDCIVGFGTRWKTPSYDLHIGNSLITVRIHLYLIQIVLKNYKAYLKY